jgi:hypothetical protein
MASINAADRASLQAPLRARFLGFVVGLGALGSCAHATHIVEIPVVAQRSSIRDALVRMNVPADWSPLVPSESRAEFLAPDNWSRVYIRAMPADASAKRCRTLARQYASEFINAWGGPPRTRVASKTSSGDTVDFELRRVDPKPHGEVIWGRVICREGALVIASCTVSTQREHELKSQCDDIMHSLEVRSLPKQVAGTPGTGG